MKAIAYTILLFLALYISGCSKCDECSNDFTFNFRFVDTDGNIAITDPARVSVVDTDNNNLIISTAELAQDTTFQVSLQALSDDILGDTIFFSIDDQPLGSAAINYGYANDSDCCTNPRTIDGADFFGVEGVRLLRVNYSLYSITLNE